MDDAMTQSSGHVPATFDPRPPWEQRTGESDYEYAWFVKFAELGDQRSVEKVSAFCGVPAEMVTSAADKHAWESRAKSYDDTVVSILEHVNIDESEALAMQYAVGMAMMRLGVSAVALKNPALIKMKDIRELMQQGAEMARRGAGVADLTVQHDVVTRARDAVLDLLED